ncbi:MAG: YggS family pyridoxal phosphate-dependent enzyme [Hyphomonas sp.]
MTDTLFDQISNRRADILSALNAASDLPVELVAVTKTQSNEALDAILATGQRVFGENRVQEAQGHWAHRRGTYDDLQLRLIGPLQTNKAEDAVALFDVIETLDREKLAAALARACEKSGRRPEIFIQVNTGNEPQKAGVSVEGLKSLYASAVEDFGLNVVGLMCIPPVGEPAGPHFALLKKLADGLGIDQLSMGMSNDYELAARFGATHVRVGSAMFGARRPD